MRSAADPQLPALLVATDFRVELARQRLLARKLSQIAARLGLADRSTRCQPRTTPDLVYICDWLPPDFGAVGQYSLLFAREMAAHGQHIVLIGLSSRTASEETQAIGSGSLTIRRLRMPSYQKARRGRRLLWTIRANTRLLRAAWPAMRRASTVLFTGSPPLFLHWIVPANLLLRRKLVYRITDFHPECAIAERGRPSVLLRLIYEITIFWRRRVHEFEVLGYDQAERLREIGIPDHRIRLKRDPSPISISPDTRPLARPAEFEGKHLLLYSGNWGVAHDVQTFLDGYAEHHRRGDGRVVLWLNAVGSGARCCRESLREAGLPFLRSSPCRSSSSAACWSRPMRT